MTNTEKAKEIRQLILQDKVPDAIEKLNVWASQVSKDSWDESLTIGANWSRLQTEKRRNIVSAEQADMRRNKLIDQLLDLTTALEKGNVSNVDPPKNENPKPVKRKDTRVRDMIISVMVLIILTAAGLYFFIGNDEEDRDNKFCYDIETAAANEYREGSYEKAYKSYKLLLYTCDEVDTVNIKRLIKEVEAKIAQNVSKTEQLDDPKKPDNEKGVGGIQPAKPNVRLQDLDKGSAIKTDVIKGVEFDKSLNLIDAKNRPESVLQNIEAYRKSGKVISEDEKGIMLKMRSAALDELENRVKTAISSGDKEKMMEMAKEIQKVSDKANLDESYRKKMLKMIKTGYANNTNK